MSEFFYFQPDLNTRLFYKKHFYKKMSLKNRKNLKKMLRELQASNSPATIFKNTNTS